MCDYGPFGGSNRNNNDAPYVYRGEPATKGESFKKLEKKRLKKKIKKLQRRLAKLREDAT